MAKRLTKQEKQLQIVQTLIDKMFEIAGHDVRYKDIEGRTDAWYQEYTMTVEQNDEWQSWGVELIRKTLKLPKKVAETEMGMMSLMWGLKFSDWEK